MKVVVTGAAGFVGFHVTQRLTSDGTEVVAIDSFENNYSVALKLARWERLASLASGGGSAALHRLDLCDFSELSQLLKQFRPDIVVHLAARPGVREGVDAWPLYTKSNLTALTTLLAAVTTLAYRPKLIYASSSSVYGGSEKGQSFESDHLRPISFYGGTKVAGEQLVDVASTAENLTAVGIRMFTVFGPWGRPDMLPWRLIRAAQTGHSLPLYGDGSARRDFTYIDEVVESIVRLISYSNDLDSGSHELFNIGGGQSISVLEAAREVEDLTGREIHFSRTVRNRNDALETLASVDKLRSVIGFSPSMNFRQGIAKSMPWFDDNLKRATIQDWDS